MRQKFNKRFFSFLSSLTFFILIIHLFVFAEPYDTMQMTASELINNIIEKNKEVNTLKIDINIKERSNSKIIEKFNHFTLQVNPFKIYFTEIKYGINVEGLYVHGENNNLAKVATKGFPWLKMDLDPLNGKIREDTHHTIFDAGFGYFVEIVEHLKSKNKEEFNSMLTYHGLFRKEQLLYYKIELNNTNFSYKEYIVKKGETVNIIGKKFKVSDYMILEKNNLKDYYSLTEGQHLLVPTDYAKKMILHIDKQLMLPLYIEIHDDRGFYASYSFSNIVVNPILAPSIFSFSNPNYHFK